MKLTTFLLIVSLAQVSAASFGQSITLKRDRLPMGKLFFEIRRQTGYDVLLKDNKVLSAKQINANFLNTPLEKVMEQVVEGTNLEYTIEDKTILIREKQKSLLDRVVDYFSAIDVSGRVVDSEGKPLPGATVTIKGTRITATTDNAGNFQLKNIDNNAILVISYVGFESVELKATENLGTIKLISSLSKLDEVQVIAYGTTTRRLSTGNIGTVKAEDIEKQPVQNPLLALQGRVPGLVVTQNTGMNGGAVTVRIQGQNSIRNGNDPLYVIDGTPINSQLPTTNIDRSVLGTPEVAQNSTLASGNPLNYLNPNDIESIDVLKDADATAIYGSRAANGAILITTKKGKIGKLKLDVDMQAGLGEVARNLKVLDTRQYLDMRYEAYRNDNIDWKASSVTANDLKVWDTTRYTNWQKELLGNSASYKNFNATISGGAELVQYRLSGTYNSQTTVFPDVQDFSDQKGSIGFNLNLQSPNRKLKVDFSGNYMVDVNRLPRTDLTQAALFSEPNAPSGFNSDGTLNWALNSSGVATYTSNPYITLTRLYENKTTNLLSNLNLRFTLLKGLDIGGNLGYNKLQTSDLATSPTTTIAPNLRATTANSATYGTRDVNSINVEPQLTYKTSMKGIDVDFLLGGTYIGMNNLGNNVLGQTYASDELLRNMASAGTLTRGGNPSLTEYKYVAGFTRLNLNYRNTYLLNLSARRDGSSRFGSQSQFNNFGAVGAGWIFSNMSMIRENLPIVSFGKLRASYGTTGSDQIADYQFISRYNSLSTPVLYQGGTSLIIAGLPSPYLQWEETRKLQLGADIAFLNDRLSFMVNYFSNSSSNQLMDYNYASIAGASSVLTNVPAKIRNRGWEYAVNGNIIKNKFQWSMGINLTVPKNELVSFPGIETTSFANLLKVGESIKVARTVVLLGVNASTGTYQFANAGLNPVNSPVYPNDYTKWIDLLPKFYGGWQNTISFSGLQLDFLFQFTKQKGLAPIFGNGIGAPTPGSFFAGISNQPANVLDRWQNYGDVAFIQKYFSGTSNANATNASFSDAAYVDASYIRLKNVSLSYALPERWVSRINVSKLSFHFQGQNLLTFTKYQGLDPETLSLASLPPLRIWTFGLKLGI